MTLNRENEDTGTSASRDLSGESGTRAGGNVVTKGPSQTPSDEAESGDKRAGGDVVTKGSSQ